VSTPPRIRQEPRDQFLGSDVDADLGRRAGRNEREVLPARSVEELQALVDDDERQKYRAVEVPLPVVRGVPRISDPVRGRVGEARRPVVPGLAEAEAGLHRHAAPQRENGLGSVVRHFRDDVGARLARPHDEDALAGDLRWSAVLRAMNDRAGKRILSGKPRLVRMLMKPGAHGDRVERLLVPAVHARPADRPRTARLPFYGFDRRSEPQMPMHAERRAISPEVLDVLANLHVAGLVRRHGKVGKGGEQAGRSEPTGFPDDSFVRREAKDTAEARRPFEARGLVALFEQFLDGGETRRARTDDGDAPRTWLHRQPLAPKRPPMRPTS
jgi:hypothetical protein